MDRSHPLTTTAEHADAAHAWLTVVFGPMPEGWLRCSEVDAAVVADWEQRAAESSLRYDGGSRPVTAASYALGWYSDIAARVGAACFLLDRRVPRLGRAAIAFRQHAEDHYPDAVALLDPRCWCLPGDPEAAHPDATVVPDEESLTARLRAEFERMPITSCPGTGPAPDCRAGISSERSSTASTLVSGSAFPQRG